MSRPDQAHVLSAETVVTRHPVTTFLVFEHNHDPAAPNSHYRFSKLHSIHRDGESAAKAVQNLVFRDPPRNCDSRYYVQHQWMDWVYDGFEGGKKARQRKPLGQGYQYVTMRGETRSLWYQMENSMWVKILGVEKVAKEVKKGNTVRGGTLAPWDE